MRFAAVKFLLTLFIFRPTHGGRFFLVDEQAVFVKNKPPFICPVCGFQSTTGNLRSLYAHMDRHIVNVVPCKICGKVPKTKALYAMHKYVHQKKPKDQASDRKSFCCAICGKSYVSKYFILKHIDTTHKQVMHSCEICGKAYSDKEYYKSHVKSHSSETKYTCKMCNRFFQHDRLYISHIRRCGIKEICHVCGKHINRSGIKSHMRRHTGEKPFSCEYCNKTFPFPYDLRVHIRVHTKERPYVCSFCGKGFTQPSSFNIHMRSHSGEKPYACHLCCKRFASRSVLNAHKKCHPS